MSEVYSGISFPFRFNSLGGVAKSKLSPIGEVKRLEESIYQIAFTSENERVMLNDFGAGLRGYLFEGISDLTDKSVIKFALMRALEKFEDRVRVEEVYVYEDTEVDGKIIIDLDVYIVKFMQNAKISLEYTTQ